MWLNVLAKGETLMQVKNTKGYAYYNENMGPELEGKPAPRKRHTLEVTFITDMVPGAFHDPEDLMNWIAQNPYVDTVTLK
jgi:hypothetical protein